MQKQRRWMGDFASEYLVLKGRGNSSQICLIQAVIYTELFSLALLGRFIDSQCLVDMLVLKIIRLFIILFCFAIEAPN